MVIEISHVRSTVFFFAISCFIHYSYLECEISLKKDDYRHLEASQLGDLLIKSCYQGDKELVELLLELNVDPNYKNISGEYPLRIAVGRDKFEIAALLLMHDADHNQREKKGKRLFDTIKSSALSSIRDYYFRTPCPNYTRSMRSVNDELQLALDELASNGIIKISQFLDSETLSSMQAIFNQFVIRAQEKMSRNKMHKTALAEEFYQENTQMLLSNNPFKYSPELVKICYDAFLLELIELYLQKRAYIEKGWMARYYPDGNQGEGILQWHHDGCGRRIKIMILLSDVTLNDQFMTYVVGSHKLYHAYETFQAITKADLNYCKKRMEGPLEIYKTLGKAGDIFIFDTNGVHSANAAPGQRDVFIITYGVDKSQVWGCEIPQESLDDVPSGWKNPFERMIEDRKSRKTLAPRSFGWMPSLKDYNGWI